MIAVRRKTKERRKRKGRGVVRMVLARHPRRRSGKKRERTKNSEWVQNEWERRKKRVEGTAPPRCDPAKEELAKEIRGRGAKREQCLFVAEREKGVEIKDKLQTNEGRGAAAPPFATATASVATTRKRGSTKKEWRGIKKVCRIHSTLDT